MSTGAQDEVLLSGLALWPLHSAASRKEPASLVLAPLDSTRGSSQWPRPRLCSTLGSGRFWKAGRVGQAGSWESVRCQISNIKHKVSIETGVV